MDNYETLRFILHLLLIILIALGSLLILWVIYVTKQYQTPSGLLIGNLALIDLLVGGFVLPFGIPAIYSGDWVSGRKLCVLCAYANHVLSSAAIFNLTAISFDRYVAIIHAIRYHQLMTLKRIALIIIIVWVIGFISGILPLLGWGRFIYESGVSLCVTDFKTNKSFTFFVFSTHYGVPLNAMFVIYFRIFTAVTKQAKAIRNNSIHPTNQNVDEPANQSEVRLTNRKADELANKNGGHATNHNSVQLTDAGEVELSEHGADVQTNSNTEQQTNQRKDKLTKKNTADGTRLEGEHNYGCNKSDKNTTNIPKRNVQTNQPKESPANQESLDLSTNKNSPFSQAANQREADVLTDNQNKTRKPTKSTIPRHKTLHKKLKMETKAAVTMFVIVGVFVFAVSPFAVYSLYCLHTGESYEIADFITTKFAYSNAMLNPVVYGLMNKLYRKGIYQIFDMIFRCKKRSVDLGRGFSQTTSFSN